MSWWNNKDKDDSDKEEDSDESEEEESEDEDDENSNYYQVEMECSNCEETYYDKDEESLMDIPKGLSINDWAKDKICENCGCYCNGESVTKSSSSSVSSKK